MFGTRRLFQTMLLLSVLWLIISTLRTFPHCLAYFNEGAGGPGGGHRCLLSSNIDWGQDLLWLRENAGTRHVWLAYLGGFDAGDIGINYTTAPFFTISHYAVHSSATNESSLESGALPPGVYAISVNLLYGQKWHPRLGQAASIIVPPNRYEGFQKREPDTRLGYSIYVFEVKRQDKTTN